MNSIVLKYFSKLDDTQRQRFDQLSSLYAFWNAQINVISRKDMDAFMERHVLHSLGIAKIMDFEAGTKVLDVGTGGGFPGIPLAILFPEVDFLLIDSIGKKIKVVQAVIEDLGLTNVRAKHQRVERITEQFDFVISRAVTRMPIFLKWIDTRFSSCCKNELPNGVLYLKGGDLSKEMKEVKRYSRSFNLSKYFEEDFFETKKVVYVQMV